MLMVFASMYGCDSVVVVYAYVVYVDSWVCGCVCISVCSGHGVGEGNTAMLYSAVY